MRQLVNVGERRLAAFVVDYDGQPVTSQAIDAFAVLRPLLEGEDEQDAQRDIAQETQSSTVSRRPPIKLNLGRLATDHVGYCSWNIERLQKLGDALKQSEGPRLQKLMGGNLNNFVLESFELHPLGGYPAHKVTDLVEAITEDAFVTKLPIHNPRVHFPGFPSMQEPCICDWRLSPGSFAINPGMFVGQDGCEQMLPASLAVHTYNFYSIVRLSDALDAIPKDLQSWIKVGVAYEYQVDWYQIGHSLGTIAYTTAIAPGESIKIAVVDWSRKATGSRYEAGTAEERLSHDTHRDRTIGETVNAAVRESQRGTSFMAGVASSIGAAGGTGAVGGAAGLAGAIGYGSATTRGSRTMSADSMQRLADNFSQASSALREYQTTVVVEATQAEQEEVRTRVITNYNHAHALTMLYYEVLRHYRVVTRCIRARPVLLIKHNLPNWLSIGDYIDWKPQLADALLDESLRTALDEAQTYYEALNAQAYASTPASEAELEFGGFIVEVRTGATTNPDVKLHLWATGIGGNVITPLVTDGQNDVDLAGAFTNANAVDSFFVVPVNGPVKFGDLWGFRLSIEVAGGAYDFAGVKIWGRTTNNRVITLVEADPKPVHLGASFLSGGTYVSTGTGGFGQTASPPGAFVPSYVLDLPSWRPPHIPSPPTPQAPATFQRLLRHFLLHKYHYARAIWLGEDSGTRAAHFDTVTWLGEETLLDQIENRPLDAFGDYVAFPAHNEDVVNQVVYGHGLRERMHDEKPLGLPECDERLITLPARGVFAEAKLGHCNSAELIDDTRFWDWQRSPIPEKAPDIAPVELGGRAQSELDTKPQGFPSSLVNIVNPSAAPDPTGLAAGIGALNALGPFRAPPTAELGALLGKLSDNSVEIAKVANSARTAGALNQMSQNAADKGTISKEQHADNVQNNLARAANALPGGSGGGLSGAASTGAEAGEAVTPSAPATPQPQAGGTNTPSPPPVKPAATPKQPPYVGPSPSPQGAYVVRLIFSDVNGALAGGNATVLANKESFHVTIVTGQVVELAAKLGPSDKDAVIQVAATLTLRRPATYFSEALDNAGTGLPPAPMTTGPLTGYVVIDASKGGSVLLNVTPVTATKKVSAKTAREAADTTTLSGTLGVDVKGVLNVSLSPGQSQQQSSSQENTKEWDVTYIKPGLSDESAGGLSITLAKPVNLP